MNTAVAAWKMERDAEGIVWLTLDKPGSSANVLGRAILEELGGLIDQIAANVPKGVVSVPQPSHRFTRFWCWARKAVLGTST